MKNICNEHETEINRPDLYRFPWSKTDNPGTWVEVTDTCNISCVGCYRKQVAGHKDFDDLKKDIQDSIRLTNCDCIEIAGGEPLIYPHILETVRYISSLKLKPVIFSNGVALTPELVLELKKAGLAKIHFHIDSMQDRPGWQGKSEAELNLLRRYYADMIHQHGRGIQCGFHVTVYRNNLDQVPDIFNWAIQNINKVQHISFIAFRTMPEDQGLVFFANGREVDARDMYGHTQEPQDITITTDEMYQTLKKRFPFLHPCAYLNGTSKFETYKFLIMVNIGTSKSLIGHLGKRTMELVQMFHHLFMKKYPAFVKNPKVGLKIFFLMFMDRCLRNSFKNFIGLWIRNPMIIFQKVYAQSLHLQQPNEIIDGRVNLCDDCVNMMAYKGQLINSCMLEQYRMFNEPVTVVKIAR